MPELPEVETVAAGLRAVRLAGVRITGARVYWPKSIAAPWPADLVRRLRGRTITRIGRRAKYLVIGLDHGLTLLVHLRMTGRLHVHDPADPRDPHEHVVISFADGRQLRLHDTRKFGRVWLTDAPERILGQLGPEPLGPEFTTACFTAMLGRTRRMLKPLLLDQGFLAGLGNIYVDEALWTAGLHPCRTSDTLKPADVKRLHAAIRAVLRRGIKNLGTSLGRGATTFYSVGRRKGRNRDQLNVFRRTGLPCPRCGTAVTRIIVGQRSTHICARCQSLTIKSRKPQV